MLIYDVDKIENLYQDFEKACKNFKNKEYDDFKSSYFYSCSDSVIVKLRNRIQTIYDNIQKGYDMIDKVWKKYIDDVGNFDKSVASGGNCGIHDGGVSSIVSKICSIDLYESAGVSTSFKSIAASGKNIGKSILNALKRTAASIINVTVFSITAGVIKFVEAITDCSILITGAVKGLYVLAFDAVKSLITGKKDFTNSKKYYNQLLKIVGYDVTGKIKGKFYETKFGKWFNDNSYAPFKDGGTVYGIGEGIGYVAGIVVLTIFTCGGGTAATVASQTASTSMQVVSGVIAGAGAMGKAAQSGYNSTVDKVVAQAAENGVSLDRNNVELDGKQIAKIIGNSAVQGGIEGTTFALTYGKGLKADKILGESLKKSHEVALKAGMQAAKEYGKAASDEIFDIKDHTFAEVTKNAATSAAVSVIYDTTGIGSKIIKKSTSITSKIATKLNKDAVMKEMKTSFAEEMKKGGFSDDLIEEAYESFSKDMNDEAFNTLYKETEEILANKWADAHKYVFDGAKKPLGTAIKNPMKETINYINEEIANEIDPEA